MATFLECVERMRLTSGTLLAAFLLALGACGQVGERESVAREFLEAYYVRADLPAARRAAVGLAREKIDREIELRKGAGETGPSPEAARERSVTIQVLEERSRTEERSTFLFDLLIGSEPIILKKRALITLGRTQGPGGRGSWVVVNFSEIDIPPTSPER